MAKVDVTKLSEKELEQLLADAQARKQELVTAKLNGLAEKLDEALRAYNQEAKALGLAEKEIVEVSAKRTNSGKRRERIDLTSEQEESLIAEIKKAVASEKEISLPDLVAKVGKTLTTIPEDRRASFVTSRADKLAKEKAFIRHDGTKGKGGKPARYTAK